jgi:hypothetical protein
MIYNIQEERRSVVRTSLKENSDVLDKRRGKNVDLTMTVFVNGLSDH